jgi:hypothetical protein
MSKPYNASNPFFPNNAAHRMEWPAYEKHVRDKLGSIRAAYGAWVAINGPIPLKLKLARKWRFKEPLFGFRHDVQPGLAADGLDEIELQHNDYTMFLSVYNMEQDDLIAIESIGMSRHDMDPINYLTDRMEQYENYILQRELFEHSNVRETLRANQTEFSYEQLWHTCNIVVPDTKAATYLKLTYG